MSKKWAIGGPESSGKTTLSLQLAHHYHGEVVPEMARIYLEKHGPDYQIEDLNRISELQYQALEAAENKFPEKVLVCDTEWVNLLLWSRIKYGKVDADILHKARTTKFDVLFLCAPDIPWEADPLREHPHARPWLWIAWLETLRTLGIPFVPLYGTQKFEQACKHIESDHRPDLK